MDDVLHTRVWHGREFACVTVLMQAEARDFKQRKTMSTPPQQRSIGIVVSVQCY